MEFDFEKNATVDSLESVPESYHGLYAKGNDGKFSLADFAKPLVDNYVGLSKNLNKTKADLGRANAESASRRVTGKAVTDLLREYGVSEVDEDNPVETAKAFIADLNEKVKGGKENQIQINAVKADFAKRETELRKEHQAQLAKMESTLASYLVDERAIKAISDHKGSVELLLPLVRSSTKVVPTEDGKYGVVILDEASQVRTNGKGDPMTPADLVASMKADPKYARAFDSAAPAGSGVKPGTTKVPVGTKTTGEKTSVQKISEGLAKRMR